MAEQYDMSAHMKRGMTNALDSFEQGNATKEDTIDCMAIYALEYHNVLLRRLIDELSGKQPQPVEPTNGEK